MKRLSMRRLMGRGLMMLGVLGLVGGGATQAMAIPTISLDTDPVTPGIQLFRSVQPGETFMVDVVLTGDGVTAFDSVILDPLYNDLGLVLAPTPTPPFPAATAGALAGTGTLVLDVFGGGLAVPGTLLTSDGSVPTAPFADNTGGVGYFDAVAIGLGFPVVGAGIDITLLDLTFTALQGGLSTILPSGFNVPGSLTNPVQLLFLGGPFGGNLIEVDIVAGQIDVVPEPGTIALFGTGLIGLLGYGWRRRQQMVA